MRVLRRQLPRGGRLVTTLRVCKETLRRLNRLGYYALYTLRAPADALEIFAANATRFPQSANVYDSLGEAYLASADTTRAIVNYRKSLSLDPRNANAATILQRLGVQ